MSVPEAYQVELSRPSCALVLPCGGKTNMKRIVYPITSEMYFCESRNLYFEGLACLFLNFIFLL